MIGNYYTPYYGQNQTSTDDRIWVQSAQAAENYLVAPNAFVRLWDVNRPVFYERRTDASGRPYPMETYEYKKTDINQKNGLLSTDSEIFLRIDDLKTRIQAIEERMNHAESNSDDKSV